MEPGFYFPNRPFDPFGPFTKIDYRSVTDRSWWWEVASFEDKAQAVKVLYRNKKITDWQLWGILSHQSSPLNENEAISVYESLGFVPFAGFPLVKA